MGVVYVYQNHSGSVANNSTGYEIAVDVPASYMYNLTGEGTDGRLRGCTPLFYQPGGTLDPAYYIYRGSMDPTIQLFDNIYGWFNFLSMSRLFSERHMGEPRLGEPYYGLLTGGSSAQVTLSLTNPVRFRISNPPLTHYATVSWTGLYFGLSDECRLPPSSPAAVVGIGECGSWSLVGAPNTSGTSLVTTLPNGAPLAGRNRVQLIS